jgi:hypothetical protein
MGTQASPDGLAEAAPACSVALSDERLQSGREERGADFAWWQWGYSHKYMKRVHILPEPSQFSPDARSPLGRG